MDAVRTTCIKSRFVGNNSYVAGEDYKIDAFIAGKYKDYFRPSGDDDIRRIHDAMTARSAADAERQSANRDLANIDPALLLVAARAIQLELAKAGKSAASVKA